MLSGKKAVYYICNEKKGEGLVSSIVWDILKEKDSVVPSGLSFEGKEVLMSRDERDNEYFFVPTKVPVCWNYPEYLPEMNDKFSACDFAGQVTWHEGASAPPKILTVHSIGDVETGIYGPASPVCMRNLLHSIENMRIKLGLDEYQTVTEATHWSGTHVSGSSPDLILKYPVPMVDIEVGSEEESWSDKTACRALADSLMHVFDSDGKRVHNLLCVGGVHFNPSFAQAVFTEWGNDAFGVSHIIANQWLVSGGYENEKGPAMAAAAAEAVEGGIEAIAFHDKLKGCYKDLVRALGEKYNVPVLKHQKLRNPADLEWKL